jgi:hypothetical protein
MSRQGSIYIAVKEALNAAHKACFQHPDRDVLGMSNGPFSGVNFALGKVAELEDENIALRAQIARIQKEAA